MVAVQQSQKFHSVWFIDLYSTGEVQIIFEILKLSHDCRYAMNGFETAVNVNLVSSGRG